MLALFIIVYNCLLLSTLTCSPDISFQARLVSENSIHLKKFQLEALGSETSELVRRQTDGIAMTNHFLVKMDHMHIKHYNHLSVQLSTPGLV